MILLAGPEDSQPSRFTADLAEAGIAVLSVPDGAQALVAVGEHRPAAILLSADLPVVSPCIVVTTARQYTSVPILLGVGPGEAETVGLALVAGATGLVHRPYAADEVITSLRRHLHDTDADSRSLLTCGPIELDPLGYRVTVGGEEIALPLKEFELLRLLMMNADRVVPLTRICKVLWGERAESVAANTVATHVARLRQHIGHDVLRTIRGVGYRLAVVDGSDPR
jgi:DNA-binding response OmpR family regulator